MVPLRLETGDTEPSERSGFKYDFDRYLQTNRRELAWGCHVLVQNWLQRGAPTPTWQGGGQPLGSFEEWSRVLGGILEAAGVRGFLANVGAYRETMREERGSELAAVEALARAFPVGIAFGSAEVLENLNIIGGALDAAGLKSGEGAINSNKRAITNYIQGNLRRAWRLTDKAAINSVSPNVIADIWTCCWCGHGERARCSGALRRKSDKNALPAGGEGLAAGTSARKVRLRCAQSALVCPTFLGKVRKCTLLNSSNA